MGDELMPAEEMNPKGFFIDLEFDYLLSECFGPNDYPAIGSELPNQIRDRVGRLILKREAAANDWGVKHIFGAALLPVIARLCESVKIVLTTRNGLSSRLSLSRHTDHDYQTIRAINDWCNRASRWLASLGLPCHLIDYDSVVDSPDAEIQRLAGFLGKEPTPGMFGIIDQRLRNF